MRAAIVVLLFLGNLAFADAPYVVQPPYDWQEEATDHGTEWKRGDEARAFAIASPLNRADQMKGLTRKQFERNLIANVSVHFENGGFTLASSKHLGGKHPAVEVVMKKPDKTSVRLRVYALPQQLVTFGLRLYPDASTATRQDGNAFITSARVR